MDEQAALSLIAGVVEGAGDDAAVLGGTVLTIDMLHERTDFPPGTSRYTAGWRSVASSLSDVAAMGARPTATVAAIGLPAFDEGELESLLDGARDVSEAVGASYVGGDLDEHEEFTVVTAAIGETDSPVGRGGANPDDLVCMTGDLGRAAAGKRAFEAGAIGQGNELFQFEPRVEGGTALSGVATAMLDASDGLARSLHQLGTASEVGFAIEGERLPVTDALDPYCGPGEQPLEVALGFGGDFELVWTMPADARDRVESRLSTPWSVIGEVVPQSDGIELDGKTLEDRGYVHG